MMWHALQRWRDRRRHGRGPWAALLAEPPPDCWVSLDLETSGLDPRRDRILTIAAVPIQHGRVLLSERFQATVRPAPGTAAPQLEALRHHRLRPQDLADGMDAHVAVAQLLDWLGPRTLIGYRIGFDIAMLNRIVPDITGFALPNARIDLVERFRARARHRTPEMAVDTGGFEIIARTLGVPMLDRHSALGDATTAAACWLALQAQPD